MEQGSVSLQNLFKIYGKHVTVYHSTTAISQLSSHPFKSASQLSSHTIMKNVDSSFSAIYWYLQQIKRDNLS